MPLTRLATSVSAENSVRDHAGAHEAAGSAGGAAPAPSSSEAHEHHVAPERQAAGSVRAPARIGTGADMRSGRHTSTSRAARPKRT